MTLCYTKFVVLLYIVTFVTANSNHWISDEFIDFINSKQNLWTAGRNFAPHTPKSYFKRLTGALTDHHWKHLPQIKHDTELIARLPQNFDPRLKWPFCKSLNEINDQGPCGSCWAFGAAEAMTDRYCIYSNGRLNFHVSVEDLLTCCYIICGDGCNGGMASQAWLYWRDEGLVSGGSYNSTQGCLPYEIPPCDHNIHISRDKCSREDDRTPDCRRTCKNNYNVDYYKDKNRGKNAYAVPNEDQIKAELYNNGPVEAVFTVYYDFLLYKKGIYVHTCGDWIGKHAVKILGWGEEYGEKYWLVANSWNSDWGDKGFFKILRGVNHCGIESSVVAGEPLLPDYL